jgi:hypothetical protein
MPKHSPLNCKGHGWATPVMTGLQLVTYSCIIAHKPYSFSGYKVKSCSGPLQQYSYCCSLKFKSLKTLLFTRMNQPFCSFVVVNSTGLFKCSFRLLWIFLLGHLVAELGPVIFVRYDQSFELYAPGLARHLLWYHTNSGERQCSSFSQFGCSGIYSLAQTQQAFNVLEYTRTFLILFSSLQILASHWSAW